MNLAGRGHHSSITLIKPQSELFHFYFSHFAYKKSLNSLFKKKFIFVLFFLSLQRDQEFKITNEGLASTGEVCPSLEPSTLFSEKLPLTQEVIQIPSPHCQGSPPSQLPDTRTLCHQCRGVQCKTSDSLRGHFLFLVVPYTYVDRGIFFNKQNCELSIVCISFHQVLITFSTQELMCTISSSALHPSLGNACFFCLQQFLLELYFLG